MTSLRGGTALVTGATAGIGLQFALELANRGMNLVLVARNQDRLSEIATLIRNQSGVMVEVIVADLSTREATDVVALRASQTDIDLVINNAGFGLNESFARSGLEAEQQLLDVLVTAVMRVSHSALPGMISRNRGGIINVSSVAGWMSSGTYSAAKAWVTTFSESMSMQLRKSQVHVMALCPGFTRTEFQDRAGMSTDTIPHWMWLDVSTVVNVALRDFAAGKPVSVPSMKYKALGFIAQYLPRPLVRMLSVVSRSSE
ncbi:MAG: SDR family oxidoreductase [Actinomycetes bacterium]